MKSYISDSAIQLLILITLSGIISGCAENIKWAESGDGNIKTVTNENGQTLGYSATSGINLVFDKGYAFKDLNRNGELDEYEDWRLNPDERAEDLASKMTIEQIAGLMLYSRHQAIPAMGRGYMGGNYNGKPFEESGAKASDLSDDQIKFLSEDNLRHILITRVQSPAISAEWNNNVQALVEGIGLGIPANNSSDPRHRTIANAEFNAGAGGDISMWPGSLGLAATFDPELVREFGYIASREYRGLGITTALSPQVDLSTEPRWNRVSGTFGEDPLLATDLARAYIDGFQTSGTDSEISGGWGYESVNAMVKHWPGGGTGEGGRDAHFVYGKYGVYPGNNFDEQLTTFINGAFNLEGGTGMASAVMPYYTISYGIDPSGKNVGNAYSSYIINDLLRTMHKYEGVVCTDWGVTPDESSIDTFFTGKCFGVEDLSVAERHYMILMAGVDQFGGNNDSGPVIEAYNLGSAEYGETFMRERFEQSAVRLLKNIFRVGLFENPYLDVERSTQIVGNADFMAKGFEAQQKSVVMLKNRDNLLPLDKDLKVYVPKKLTPAGRNFMGNTTPERLDYPVNIEIVKKYFTVTEDPAEANVALVFIDNPSSGGGYSNDDVKSGGNGYVPISLQYNPYTAVDARDPSLAGGDPLESFINRSYKGKTVRTNNHSDLNTVLDTKKVMKDKPVVVTVNLSNPMVFSEIEPLSDAILVHFGVQDQALMNIMTGIVEPSGLLPVQMPADMKTVETQHEDRPHDMDCYTDTEGKTYDFAFGLNWNGIISDMRTVKYKKSSQ